MNPYKLKNVFEYLTSNNQLLKKKLKLGTSEIPIPPKRQDVIDVEVINRFTKANPRVDTTNLKPLSVKQSNVKKTENFAEGGRIGYKDGPKLTDFLNVQASGSKSGKQQIQGAPEGITSDKEIINAIITMDIPLTEKVNLIGDLQYGKFRDRIEYNDDEIFLDDPKSYRNRNIGLEYNRGGEGFSGSATVGDRGSEYNIRYKKSFADGGMLVQPNDDGSRPGYKGERVYTTDTPSGKKSLGLTKEQNKWFNKTHKNNSKSRFYKKDWSELAGKKSDILDSYDNELLREKPPKGYITTKEFSKKYNFPIYDKIQYGPVTKAESNFINNALMKSLGEKDIAAGRKNLLTKKFITDTLEPKQFETLIDLGDGKKSVKKVNYIKDSPKLAKKLKTYLDSPFVQAKTRENMTKVLKNNKIKTLFNKGDYKGIVKALGEIKNLTNAERANVMLRISQAMSGVNFRDFDHGLKPNKPSANKIFKGLETGRAGVPTEYNDAYKALKFNTIKDSIGDEYFTKSYKGFIEDARSALKKSGIDVTDLDLNEITGLSSGYKNQTFSSTQFVNFMDNKFNQGAHASMIGEYGRYETALQTALKNGTVSFKGQTFTPRQLINNWQEWRGDWFNRLDDKYKTKNVKDILPSFKLGKDPYSFIGKKRLSELLDQGLDLKGEGVKVGYAKTFPNIKTSPILKEISLGDEKAIKQIIASFGGGTCSVFSGKKATLKADGGRIGLATGTPNIDDCFKSGSAVINSGKVPVDKADDFVQLLKRAGGIGRNIMKFGIIPEAMYVAADSLIRVGMGDTFTEAALRASDYVLPGDQTKTAEISKVSRIFGDETGELVGRAIDYKNQLAKIKSLEQQKENFENLSDGGEFSYVGDLSSDVKNTENLLSKAKKDLDNKFKISEAEQLYAESKQDDAYDASKATSFLSNLKRKYGDSSNNLSDIETLAAPEKTQMELNLNMLPNFREAMKNPETRSNLNYANIPEKDVKKYFTSQGKPEEISSFLQYQKDLKDAFSLNKLSDTFGKEQVYGTQGTFGGEPVDMTNYQANSNRFGSQQRPVLYPKGRNPLELASGGIASLTKTIPPESGPTPQGLPYVYNNVKKI